MDESKETKAVFTSPFSAGIITLGVSTNDCTRIQQRQDQCNVITSSEGDWASVPGNITGSILKKEGDKTRGK